MEVFDAKEQAEASGHKPAKKGGRKPMLSEQQRRENKIKCCKNFRLRKANEYKRSEAENKSLKEEIKGLRSDINSSNKELSEAEAQAKKLEADLSDQSKIVHEQKKKIEALNTEIEQMQHDFLNWDVQDDLDFNDITMDHEWLNSLENLKVFNKNTDSLLNEGTSIAKTKLSPLCETVTVEGFRVLRENSPIIQEIFNNYPSITSSLRVRLQASRDGFMNILAEVYKMATMERECNLEDIKYMEDGVEDLEFAGLDVSWLKDLVQQRVGKRLKRMKK